jgi:hypothetical protein
MHWFPPFSYMEAKFGPLEKWIKTIDSNRGESFQKNSQVHPFWPQKEWRNLEELRVETVDDAIQIGYDV